MRSLLWIMLTAWSSLGQTATTELTFDVFLDDEPIGFHRVSIQEMPGERRVQVEAEMEVDFLFFTAFSYRHRADELWREDCIFELETRTDDDGQRLSVDAGPLGDALEVVTPSERKRLDGCVRTFAYWDRDFLDASELLNSQTGELVPVEVEALEPRRIPYLGSDIEAQPYRLTGEGLQLEVFYAGDRWVGLESTVEGGRILRYEMVQEA